MTDDDLRQIAERCEAAKSYRPGTWDAWCLHAVSDVASLLAHVRALQTKLAGLADLADQWAAASHTPMGEAYLVTKTQMANELKQAIAADLVADAVAERCEENTNRENDDANDKS
jgi:hypothetical protein